MRQKDGYPHSAYGAYAVSIGRHAAVAMTRMAR
jgi:hypothetical protein